MVENLAIPLLHLLESMRRIEGSDGDVATVDDAETFFEGINLPDCVVAASLLLT